jgi:hypothetical protein
MFLFLGLVKADRHAPQNGAKDLDQVRCSRC